MDPRHVANRALRQDPTNPRHVWTITTRQRYGATYYLPQPCVFDHGLYVWSKHPMSEREARATASLFIDSDARITSAYPGLHAITTRHQIGRNTKYAHAYDDGYKRHVAA